MNKLLYIPRALFDIIKIWIGGENGKKRSLAYTLFLLKWKKWVSGSNTIIEIPIWGVQWKVYNNESTQFLLKEIFVNEVYRIPKEITAEKVLDLGANVGFSVLYFSKANPVEVVALEPEDKAFELLIHNTGRLAKVKINTHQKAIADFDGQLFENINGNLPPASINAIFSIEGKGKSVDCIRLAALIEQEKFDIIKMDIEGAEEMVLKDCFEIGMIDKIPCWFIEFHDAKVSKNWIRNFEVCGFNVERRRDVFCFYRTI